MSSPVYRSLMIHLCTLRKFVAGVSAAPTYGHQPTTTTTPVAVAVGIPCRLQQLSAEELVAMEKSGTVVGSHTLYVAWELLPTELNSRTGPTRFQVVDVYRKKGNVLIDVGPFDIEEVADAAGEGHHAEMRLKRVG